jgi:glycerophosphoryl diester phosphodiesterase
VGRTQFTELKNMPYLKDGKETEATIDLLDEFLENFKDNIQINLDAKTIHFFDFEFADKIISIIRNHHLFHSVWISCFNPFLLQILKLKKKNIKTGYLFQTLAPIHTLYDKTVYSDAWHPHFNLVDNVFMKKTEKLKKQVFAWTVNDIDAINDIIKYPVDGIITDNVKLVKKELDKPTK